MKKIEIDDWSLEEPPRSWRGIVATMPALSAGFIPVGACPVCIAATAGILSSLGLGFLLESRYLLMLTAAFLTIALLTLGYGARARRGFWPLAVGAGSAIAIVLGKFELSSDPVLYIGLAGLITAAVWNAWPKRATISQGSQKIPCRACQPPV